MSQEIANAALSSLSSASPTSALGQLAAGGVAAGGGDATGGEQFVEGLTFTPQYDFGNYNPVPVQSISDKVTSFAYVGLAALALIGGFYVYKNK